MSIKSICLFALILFFISCAPQESISPAENEIETQEINKADQEVKNRLFFLKEFVGLESLTTESFPSVYQAIFDPLSENGNSAGRSNCNNCDYIPSSCVEFGLYLKLLESSCRTQMNSPVDFCGLYQNCSQCCIQTCPESDCFPDDEEVDTCENACPNGYDCENGTCVDNRTDCEINDDLIADFSSRPRSYWASECGVPVSQVRIVTRGAEVNIYLTTWGGSSCPALVEYNRLLWKKYHCECMDRGFEDFCDCIC